MTCDRCHQHPATDCCVDEPDNDGALMFGDQVAGRLGHPRPPRDGWRPCPHCWQQGRIHYDGTWRVCPWCLGVREVHQ